jgi:hypothetical protein
MRFRTETTAERKVRLKKWLTMFAIWPTQYTNTGGHGTSEWCWLERYMRTSRDGDGCKPWIRMPATCLLTTTRNDRGVLENIKEMTAREGLEAMIHAKQIAASPAPQAYPNSRPPPPRHPLDAWNLS